MSGHLLVVGDPVADHLVPAVCRHAERAGWVVRVVGPFDLADLSLTTDERTLSVEGRRVDAVVFRLSLDLLVAPGFADDDRGFATDELRAVWAHALSIPTVATPNRGVAAHSLLRDPQAWRDLLVAHGVPTAPVSIGRAPAGSCWLHADGSLRPRPDARVVRTLGMATVPARRWRSVVCCGGEVEPGLPRAIDTIARSAAQVLAGAGLGLAELRVDQLGRVLTVGVHPVITADCADWVAGALLASCARSADRNTEEDLACCS